MATKSVLILYHSKSGNTEKMANAIAEGVRPSSAEVTLESIEKFQTSQLTKFDCLVIGSPTYFSNVAWQVKKLIDESIVHYYGGKLKGKVAGLFTSSGTKRDGKSTLKMLEVAFGFHHGMKVMEGVLRVDGEKDEEVREMCREYGKRLVTELEKGS